MLYITKRDGRRVHFTPFKIRRAVLAAFQEVDNEITEHASKRAGNIADFIENYVETADHEVGIEEIQDLVEKGLMAGKRKDVAKAYILYREKRDFARKNPIDAELDDMLGYKSEYWKRENSNKNAKVLTTQRDYMAGIVSKNFTRRYLLPKDVVEAHDKGAIHFHK